LIQATFQSGLAVGKEPKDRANDSENNSELNKPLDKGNDKKQNEGD
jgi:hypothetical protein